MPASKAINISNKEQISLSEIRKKVNFTLVVNSRDYFNNLYNSTDEFIKKNWHNVNISQIQSFDSHRLFKLFAANDSAFSASLYTHLRMMVDTFTLTAFKSNKTTFKEGQLYLNSLIEKLNYEDDWTEGFSQASTLLDQIGRIGRNLLTSDNASAALFVQINDKTYEVERFYPIDCDRVYFDNQIFYNKKPPKPYIYQNGTKVILDVVNFLWQPLDPDTEELTGNNPLRPALRNTFTKIEFLDNLRKVLKNQAWPKIKVVIDEEAVINMSPAEIRNDSKQLIEFLNNYVGSVKDQLTNIEADQNLVVYDTIKEMSFLESKSNFDPRPIAELLDSEAISALKAPPSTVGKGGSTRTGEGLASAELVIFRRSVKALRRNIENIFSRAFTLALRLKGLQGYAKFRLKEFTLRPPEESAQYDRMRQDTIIKAWAIGSIGDKEKDYKIRAMHDLDGFPPEDAELRPDMLNKKQGGLTNSNGSEKQTGRTPVSNESKEKKREETRKRQKTGSDRKNAESNLRFDFEKLPFGNFNNVDTDIIPFLAIKKDKVDWKKLYKEGNSHWADDLQPSKFAQSFAEKMVDKKKESVLEIGCGNGKDSILFALAKRKVTAIDLVPEAIEIAKSNAKKSKVKIDFQVGSAEKLQFKDESFAALFTLSVLHSTNIKKSIQESYRVLEKEGIAFIYIYSNVEKIDGTKNSFISVDEFIDLVKKTGFEISDIYTSSEEEYDEAGEKHSVIVSELKK